MRLLLDTHILIWASNAPERLPAQSRRLLEDIQNDMFFSVVSLWEVGVKRALKRPDFLFDPRILRGELLTRGFIELPVSGDHVLAVEQLPLMHRDPFDRLLLCQAVVEGLTILTNDNLLTQYPVSVLHI